MRGLPPSLSNLHLVQVIIEGRKSFLQPLTLAGFRDDDPRLGCGVEGVAREDFPVVKDALREGLSSCV